MGTMMSQKGQKLSPMKKFNIAHTFHSKCVLGCFFWTKWLFKYLINEDQAGGEKAIDKL